MRGLLARFLGELGLLDLVFQLLQLVATFLVAELLLDRLHLLVEVVLALRLLHLPLDAGADALFHLQDGDLALHQAEHLLQALGDGQRLQDVLLVGNLDGKMRSDGVGELGVILDLLDHADHFGRHFLVQLHIIFEFGDHRARHGLRFHAVTRVVGERGRVGFIVVAPVGVLENLCARGALDQHLDGAVGQLEQLQDARQRADLENRIGRRIVVGSVLLRGQQDKGVGTHHFFQRLDRLFTADEERNDHVREHHDVAQRQNRIGPGFAGLQLGPWFSGHWPIGPFVVPPSLDPRLRHRHISAGTVGQGGTRGSRPSVPLEGCETLAQSVVRYDLSYAVSLRTL